MGTQLTLAAAYDFMGARGRNRDHRFHPSSLGAGPSVSDPSGVPGIPSLDAPRAPQAPQCACRQAPAPSNARGSSLAVSLGLLGLWVVRRRGK